MEGEAKASPFCFLSEHLSELTSKSYSTYFPIPLMRVHRQVLILLQLLIAKHHPYVVIRNMP